MKRSILLTLVVALALAVGISTSASSNVGNGAEAQATAKKKAKKCKAKKKAKKSLAANAAKKKKAKCAKPKKGKKKADAGFKLSNGVYSDSEESVELIASDGGKTARLSFPLSCFKYQSETVPLTISGDTAKASEDRDLLVAGEPSHMSWSITVKSTLSFTLKASWDVGNGICKSSSTTTGKFVKKS